MMVNTSLDNKNTREYFITKSQEEHKQFIKGLSGEMGEEYLMECFRKGVINIKELRDSVKALRNKYPISHDVYNKIIYPVKTTFTGTAESKEEHDDIAQLRNESYYVTSNRSRIKLCKKIYDKIERETKENGNIHYMNELYNLLKRVDKQIKQTKTSKMIDKIKTIIVKVKEW